jgi:immune inhibitor A
MKRILASTLLFAAMLLASIMPAFASPPIGDVNPDTGPNYVKPDDLPDPNTEKQRELKAQAIDAKLHGEAVGKVHEVAKGQYVELEREGEGALWTVLGEFADFPHNNIVEPDRSVDNTTLWVPDFNRDHYMEMLFSEEPGVTSMRNFYIEQSSNRYTVHGDVTDWVPVPNDAAYYDDSPSSNVWYFINDSIDGWYQAQVAAGKTDAEINEYLSEFDQWDRYDYDDDGNFDEPDGYIDTFQSVHSGEGEEAGGGALGSTAIWSHSWYAYSNRQGPDGEGPSFNPDGGVRIGDSDYWVGKYTVQPENGGVGVFAHEFGHDLGLPDLYDTSGGENGTGFWTLMSSGSWMGDGTEDIGSKPDHMGAFEKLQLGWLNYELAFAGEKSEHKLGPVESNTKQAQAVVVVLPEKEVVRPDGSIRTYSHYYVAEFRQYRGYDSTLEVGPYNWGFQDNPVLANWVEHFPYQDGLLISYWNTEERNNQTRRHPGEGLLLPVDAHPTAMIRPDGGVWRNRIQTFDSTFTLDPTDALTLHWDSVEDFYPSLPAVPMFDDSLSYYDELNNPQGSVIVPNTGTQIRIQSISAQNSFMQIQVRPAK